MVVNKRKKNTRAKGSKTHFYGSKKKHRGAGSRGGRGLAGSGKKADQKKPRYWKDTKYFGNFGFASKSRIKINAISLKDLSVNLPEWTASGIAKNEAGAVSINLEDAGYNKLLSNGKCPKSVSITVPYASKSAVEKVESAGGSVLGLLEKKKEKKEKPPASKK